jgi:hypothetical protein
MWRQWIYRLHNVRFGNDMQEAERLVLSVPLSPVRRRYSQWQLKQTRHVYNTAHNLLACVTCYLGFFSTLYIFTYISSAVWLVRF